MLLRTVLSIFACLLAFEAAPALSRCLPLVDTNGRIQEAKVWQQMGLGVSKGAKVELAFFAAWCASCRKHLLEQPKDPRLIVGTFDTRERLEAALKALGKEDAPCIFDDGERLAKEFKVQDVPARRELILE